MNKGIVFNIQKFSIHDGPGIRTTVFLKGCPLRCQWCSNPESQLEKIQILHDYKKCIHCKKCISTCPQKAITMINDSICINSEKCIGCLQCIHHCPTEVLSHEGDYKTIDEVVAICLQDKDFYEESNGGVTLSGGEGMSQSVFVEELIKKLKKEKIHVAIETTGYIESSIFQKLSPMFDLLLFDVKHYDSQKHCQGTGVYNELIIDNLRWAIEHNMEVLPRIPVIPDFNDTLDDAKGLAELLLLVKAKKVQILPFHQFGEKKYELLHRKYALKNKKSLYPEDLQNYQQVFLDKGIDCFF
jgi:pyruvate formate lyase activating enzyme